MRILKNMFKFIFSILFIIFIMFISFLAYMMINEYKPKDIEIVEIMNKNQYVKDLELNENYKIMTYNIGYGGLDANHDFFMDGGIGVRVENEKIILNNIVGDLQLIKEENPDILLIQEMDENSKRSYYINQILEFNDFLKNNSVFAYNFLTKFVPIPINSPLGKISSGLYTNSKFNIESSIRIQQPVFFNRIVRLFNLKRAILETRYKIKDSNKELVVFNLHIDAYVDNEAKKAQTKQIVDLLEKEYENGNYVIAGGDFNRIIIESKYNNRDDLDKLYLNTDNFKIYADKNQPTARKANEKYDKNSINLKTMIIDGFIISNNVEVNYVETINNEFEYSDHNPVILEFLLK